MADPWEVQADFRARVRDGAALIGTFVKTPAPQVIEVLAATGLDCLVLDAEHAAFSATTLDLCMMAARAGGIPALVRVPTAAPEAILAALDIGAAGVLVPHVKTAEAARAAVRAAHYGPDGRGFSGSTRAGGYGTLGLSEHLRRAGRGTTVICQIEDVEAIDNIDEIVAVDGVDALFIGRADLTVAYGCERLDDPVIDRAVAKVCASARKQGRTLAMFLPNVVAIDSFHDLGVAMFVVGSDQGLIGQGARRLAAAFSSRRSAAAPEDISDNEDTSENGV